MRVLLLGGTAFLGRAIARHAVAAGVRTTCLARGTQPPPADVDLITADRDDAHALEVVAGTLWDAVIDLTSTPGHARRAAQRIRTRHWVYVSSSSVYRPFTVADQDETSPILPPLVGDAMADMSEYGAAKVACEEAFREVEQPLTVLRPGLIGGYGDQTGRSGYYPWRFAHPTGKDVLVPAGDGLISLIDVEDLAAWIVHCVTATLTGTFNVAGETVPLSQLYDHCRTVAGTDVQPREVPDDLLLAHGIQPWLGPRSLRCGCRCLSFASSQPSAPASPVVTACAPGRWSRPLPRHCATRRNGAPLGEPG